MTSSIRTRITNTISVTLSYFLFSFFAIDDDENKENNPQSEENLWFDRTEEEELSENTEQNTKNSALKILEMDPNDNKFKNVKYHLELTNTWLKWKNEGLPDKNKKDILESYNRKDEFY